MKTPTKLPSDGHSPISYDVESNAKSRFSTKFLDSMAKTNDGSGDADIWNIKGKLDCKRTGIWRN